MADKNYLKRTLTPEILRISGYPIEIKKHATPSRSDMSNSWAATIIQGSYGYFCVGYL